jgi:hypothetical protein
VVRDRQAGGASVAQLGNPNALFGGQHRGTQRAQHVVVGGRAGVTAGPEAVQHPQGGEGTQPILGGVQVVEGEFGELVVGEHPMVGQQPAQLPVAFGEAGGQLGQLAGLPVGASPGSTTRGCRHHITACESATRASVCKPP